MVYISRLEGRYTVIARIPTMDQHVTSHFGESDVPSAISTWLNFGHGVVLCIEYYVKHVFIEKSDLEIFPQDMTKKADAG